MGTLGTRYRTITNKTGQSIDIGNTGHKIQNDHKQDWTIHRHRQHWTQDTERLQTRQNAQYRKSKIRATQTPQVPVKNKQFLLLTRHPTYSKSDENLVDDRTKKKSTQKNKRPIAICSIDISQLSTSYSNVNFKDIYCNPIKEINGYRHRCINKKKYNDGYD